MPDERLFTLFEMTPDLVCIVSKDGYFLKINPAVSKKLGYTEEELMAVPVSTFIHPDDRELTAAKRAQLLDNQPLLNFQNRYCTKGGDTLWLEWTSIYLPAKETVFAIAKDITVHKHKELELQESYARFRQLATHFKNGIEKDRKQFASDLHDDLGQLATVVKTEIEWISSQAGELSPQLHKHMQSLATTTQLLVNNIRKISYSVSPGGIADLGLDTAMEALCSEFSALTGNQCQYKGSFNAHVLSYEVQLDVYRVCQEALLNVMQHTGVSLVNISIQQDDAGRLRLSVTDNGKSLDQQSTGYAAGIANMRSRAQSINGHLSVNSTDNGTTVEFAITPGHGEMAHHRVHQ